MSRTKKILVIAGGVVAAGAITVFVLQMLYERGVERDFDASLARDETGLAANSSGSAGDSGPTGSSLVAVQPYRGRYCTALAPAGWRITDQAPDGTTFSVESPDGMMKAAYGSFGATNASQTVDQVRDLACAEHLPGCADVSQLTPEQMGAQSPEDTVKSIVSQIQHGDAVFVVAPQPISFGYTVLNFTGITARGFAMYRTYSDGTNTAFAMRLAIGSAITSDRTLAVAGAVATSIRCAQQLRPPPPPPPSYWQGGDKPAATGASTKCQVWSPNCNDSDFAGSYNQQLGTGYVHSETCDNYIADPDKDKWENGPDGPGYYKKVGNNAIKLLPGRCDD